MNLLTRRSTRRHDLPNDRLASVRKFALAFCAVLFGISATAHATTSISIGEPGKAPYHTCYASACFGDGIAKMQRSADEWKVYCQRTPSWCVNSNNGRMEAATRQCIAACSNADCTKKILDPFGRMTGCASGAHFR